METEEEGPSERSYVSVEERGENGRLRVNQSLKEIKENERGNCEDLHESRREVVERDDDDVDGPRSPQ